MRSLLLLVVLFTSGVHSSVVFADNDRLLKLLATGNHFALMRHALAPGTGDPANFNVNDCSTQRNLNDKGRQQAVAIGAHLKAVADLKFDVYSSQWCRCMETATLLAVGAVTPMPEINSFFADRSTAESQTRATTDWLINAKLPVLLVTHQVNITALTGVYPTSGEIVVMKREADGTLVVAGSLDL